MDKGDKVRFNHELLIWVGFTLSNGVWSDPDGVTVDNGVPYFPEDETACFKWLVPRVRACRVEVEYLCMINIYWCVIVREPLCGDIRAKGETSALALCLSIQKLIRSK